MKKYLVGIIAVLTAISSFTITKSSNNYLGCNPTIDYIWYEVKIEFQIPCANYQTVTAAQLKLEPHIVLTNDPLADNIAAGFKMKESEAIDFFSCPSSSTYLCAVAYYLADVTTAKFVKIELPLGSGNFVWSPKTGVNRPIPACAICRPD